MNVYQMIKKQEHQVALEKRQEKEKNEQIRRNIEKALLDAVSKYVGDDVIRDVAISVCPEAKAGQARVEVDKLLPFWIVLWKDSVQNHIRMCDAEATFNKSFGGVQVNRGSRFLDPSNSDPAEFFYDLHKRWVEAKAKQMFKELEEQILPMGGRSFKRTDDGSIVVVRDIPSRNLVSLESGVRRYQKAKAIIREYERKFEVAEADLMIHALVEFYEWWKQAMKQQAAKELERKEDEKREAEIKKAEEENWCNKVNVYFNNEYQKVLDENLKFIKEAEDYWRSKAMAVEVYEIEYAYVIKEEEEVDTATERALCLNEFEYPYHKVIMRYNGDIKERKFNNVVWEGKPQELWGINDSGYYCKKIKIPSEFTRDDITLRLPCTLSEDDVKDVEEDVLDSLSALPDDQFLKEYAYGYLHLSSGKCEEIFKEICGFLPTWTDHYYHQF